MEVAAKAVQIVNKPVGAWEHSPFEKAGLPEGQYEQEGPDESAVILPFRDPHGGTADVELFHDVAKVEQVKVGEDDDGNDIIVEIEIFEAAGTKEHEETGLVLPASAGETAGSPEAGFAETADSGGDEDDYEELNDALVYGTEPEGFGDFLARPATFLIGEMWGAKDRRNTQDGDWRAVTMPWRAWIMGGDGNKNQKSWGFSRHPVGKIKEGSSIVLGSSIEGARKANAMDEMYALGLDIDSGAALDDVVATIRKKNLFALIYTSHSHGKSGLEIKRDDVLRKLGIRDAPTLSQVQEYLRTHSKSRYEETFIAQVRITDPKKQTSKGVMIALSTPPLDKFRIIFPLEAPVKLIDLAATQLEALEVWENKITGMAWEALGVHFDTSCTDPSRLFYTARHAADAEWDCLILRGAPLRFEDVPSFKKHQYTKHRTKMNPFEIAGGDGDEKKVPECQTTSGKSLNDWHYHAKDRFQLATLLEDLCPDKIRHAGGEAPGHVHVECPWEHEHSKEGGTGTMAIDALDSQTEYWTWFCHHDSCQGRHKLEFLEEALRQGWFDEDVLFDEDGLYLMPPGEEVEAEERRAEVLEKLAIAAETMDKDTTDRQIRGLLTQAHAEFDVIGETGKAALVEAVAGKTRLGVREIGKLWKEVAEERVAKDVADEARARSRMATPNYIPMSEATPETVSAAAEASKWLPSGFVHRKGWFYQMMGDKPMPVSREFEVLYSADGKKGSTRTNEVTIRYQHRTRSLGVVESTFRIGDMYKDSGTILGRLRNEGLDFAAGAPTEAVLTLLRAINSDREAVYVERSGWLSDTVYVSPTGEVVKKPDDTRLYVLDHTMRVSNAKAGTLDMAVEAASAALRGRNAKRFLPGFLGGAVGCLVDFLDEELAVIIANEGKAKHGKTTSLKAGISWFAAASAEGLLITGNVTPTAIEAKAVVGSGAMFAADEQGASKASAADEQASALQYAGRIGRARGKTDGTLRDMNTWHGCMGMSTERGLLDRLEAEQALDRTIDIRSGALSRIFTVNYDSAIKLSREDDAEELAAYDVLAHGGAYGWLGPVFAAKLIELGVETVRGRVSALVSEWGVGRSGAAERVVRTAALFGVAAQIAQEAGLLRKGVKLTAMLADLLIETLDQRAHHLDTERQAKDTLRNNIIRMLNRRQIVQVGCADEAKGDVVGYWNTPGGMNSIQNAALSARTYILPVNRLGTLVKTEVGALVEQLRDEDAVVLPGSGTKYYKRGLWENTPGEGKKVTSLRIKGEWVHGDDRDAT